MENTTELKKPVTVQPVSTAKAQIKTLMFKVYDPLIYWVNRDGYNKPVLNVESKTEIIKKAGLNFDGYTDPDKVIQWELDKRKHNKLIKIAKILNTE